MAKEKKAALKLIDILQTKPRTSDKFLQEALKSNIKRTNFFTQRKNLFEKGEIKWLTNPQTGEKTWTITQKRDQATLNEIELCLDEIKSQDTRFREMGADAFVTLCQKKSVIHDPRIRDFFKTIFQDDSIRDVLERILLAFKFVLLRTLQDENYKMFSNLFNENKKTLRKFATSNPLNGEKTGLDLDVIRWKKKALFILSLAKGQEVLDILYDVIENSSAEEYSRLKAEIVSIFCSYPEEFQSEIKREIFRIATKQKNKDKEDIIDRAITLLHELSEPDERLLA